MKKILAVNELTKTFRLSRRRRKLEKTKDKVKIVVNKVGGFVLAKMLESEKVVFGR